MPPRPYKDRRDEPGTSGQIAPNAPAGQPAASGEESGQERIMAEMIRKMLNGQLE